MRASLGSAFGLLAAVIAGCGSSTSRSDAAPGTPAAACGDYATKFCARFEACAPGLMPLFGLDSMAACATDYRGSCEAGLAAPQTGNTPSLVEQCGDGLGTMTCPQFLSSSNIAPCFPHGGTIADGGACSDSWQCASGRCTVLDPAQCGTCVPQAAVGEPCTGIVCGDNLVCSATAPGAPTTVCTPPVDLGGPCNDGAVCAVNATCDGTTHTCTKLPAVNAACDPASVYFCDPAGPLAFCDPTTSRCVATPVVAPGGACDPTGTANTCAGVCLSYADASGGTCTATIPLGGACGAGDVCVSGYPCADGVCAVPICDGTTSTDAGTSAAAARFAARPRLRFGLPF
jgi:hypothetical protein